MLDRLMGNITDHAALNFTGNGHWARALQYCVDKTVDQKYM